MPKKGKGKGKGGGKEKDDSSKSTSQAGASQPQSSRGRGRSEAQGAVGKTQTRKDETEKRPGAQPPVSKEQEARKEKTASFLAQKQDYPELPASKDISGRKKKLSKSEEQALSTEMASMSLRQEAPSARKSAQKQDYPELPASKDIASRESLSSEMAGLSLRQEASSARKSAPKRDDSQLSASSVSKDESCRPKTLSKSEQQSLLTEGVGLSLKHEASSTSKSSFVMAKRPGYGVKGSPIPLFVNYFKLAFKDGVIYHYDIDIAEADKNKKKGRSLMDEGRTAKEDIKKNVKHVERQKRRNIGKAKCRQIIAEMITSKALKQYFPVYDGQKNLFTCKKLPLKGEESYPVNVTIDENEKHFFVTIKPVEKEDRTNIISLEPLIKLYSQKPSRSSEIPQEVLLVYDTILTHRDPPFHQVQFRNSFFPLSKEDNVSPLGNGLEIWYGYHQSVRLAEVGPVVIINLAAKAFHKAGSVIEYASDVLNTDITKIPRLQNWQFDILSKSLRGVQVKVTHQKHPRKYKIKGLTRESAKDLLIDMDKRKISVAQYFHQKYQVSLKYSQLPCLHMQTSTNTTYIPMETCEIVEGQPKIGKLDANLTSKMIRTTAIPPKERFNYIGEDAKEVKRISDSYLKAYGLIMDIQMMKVDGRIIAAPMLGYAGYTDKRSAVAQPDNRGVWRIEDGKEFYQITRVQIWVLISFADERRYGRDLLNKYCDFLVKSGKKCGMTFGAPKSVRIFRSDKTTEAAILEAKQSGAQFAIVVLNRNDKSHTYDEVKFLADFKHNLVTQCMEDKTIGRINDQITTNVCLKLNVKLGGINHVLLQKPQIFSRPVIVFGADAIHWTRGLGYPSILSVVGSLNPTASRFALTCNLQRNERNDKISQEIIRDMQSISKDILDEFRRANKGVPPYRIIFYRDGVSEGQFQHALEYEVSGLQKACMDLFQKVLPITYIVVQKRHQTRFLPSRREHGVGKCQNVPPGTVVDRNITHPIFFDYFICSHEGIQGTSKPAHYTVLHDDNNFSADDIQQLSHFLCHTYVRCTRSVSLPAPVLYADLAAARAKKYADLFVSSDTASVSSDGEEIQRDLPPHVERAIKSMKSFENNMFYI